MTDKKTFIVKWYVPGERECRIVNYRLDKCCEDIPGAHIVASWFEGEEPEFNIEKMLGLMLIDEICGMYAPKKRGGTEAGQMHAYVHCNDVFVWGASDCEPLPHEEIPTLFDFWIKDPENGPLVWCCIQRKTMPQEPMVKYLEAGGVWKLKDYGLAPNPSGEEYAKDD